MLNTDALNQLNQLKKDIQSSKEYGTGTVVGSSGRFGFVKLEDGRDAYLSPDKMQRVLPGDTVKVSLSKNAKDKLDAELESLISPGLTRFVGQYRVKGAAHFVEPDARTSGRWIFLPPKSRAKCQDGDYVVAKLLHHPFRDGKPSAKVLECIGNVQDQKFELSFIKAKYTLNYREQDAERKQMVAITKRVTQADFGKREDLSDIPFVTIDAATTRDMDDALAIEVSDNRFTLRVAIADPASFIEPGSPLAKRCQNLGQTVYLTGGTLPMLPEQLSHHDFSLEPQQSRPALVFSGVFDAGTAKLIESQFSLATVVSHHKLSYEQVSAIVEDKTPCVEQNDLPDSVKEMLKHLADFATSRREYRREHYLLGQDQADYDFTVNDKGHIAEIHRRSRTLAHTIVEEAMLITNQSGAELLRHQQQGLCISHPGFRQDRLGEVRALLKEEKIEHADLTDLNAYVALFHRLERDEEKTHLSAPLRRMTDSARITREFAPHMGVGMPEYTTITSPIRRFVDLSNHWALRNVLLKESNPNLDEQAIETLSEQIHNGKQADRELKQWLLAIFAKQNVGEKALGHIRIVTQNGFGVRLYDQGIEGFVLFGKDKEKKYDAKRMTLEVDKSVYQLEQEVMVSIESVDLKKRRIAFAVVKEQ